MNYVLLILAVAGVAMQQILEKRFNGLFGETEGSAFFHNFFMSLTAFLCFLVIFLTAPEINMPSLPYSVFFAGTVCTALTFELLAIRTGPLALTALVMSFSLLIPSLYGVLFLDESLSAFGIAGLVLFVVSLLLVAEYGKSERKITKKYLAFLALAFLGNGLCSTVQKVHQIDFDGKYGPFFMAWAMATVTLFNLIFFLSKPPKKKSGIYKKGTFYACLTGFFNGLVNYMMVLLATLLPAVIVFPTVGAGGTLTVFIVAVTVFKERFLPRQYIGYACGIAAIVLMNI